MPTSPIVRGGITLPRSAGRKDRDTYCKLLSHVDPHAEHGFSWEGIFFRAGRTVTDAELHPSPAYPETPILLESFPGPVYGIPGNKRRDMLRVLWRYEAETNSWRELGRASSPSWHWTLDLGPLALRALREARGGALVVMMPDLPAIATRIAAALDGELRNLEGPDRLKVLGVLHDQFAARLCA